MTLSLLWALASPADAAEAVHRYALLIGANDGGRARVTLKYAHRDALNVSSILTELGGLDPSRTTLLLDPEVQDLDAALGALGQQLSTDTGRTEVFFYYSGHSDEEGLMLGEDHFPYTRLRDELEGLPAGVRVAILDSCASGAMVRAKGGQRVAPFLVDESNRLDGFAIITSSAADEVAQEADRIGGSYFTHYLSTGLRGAADMSDDGRVTLDEAYAYAHAETLARTERSQHGPQHANRGGGLDGQGQLVLTDLQLTTASLVLDDDLDGRVLIRDDDGDLVAELLKPRGRAIELGLGAGVYDVVFTVRDSDRYAVATVTLARGSSTLLESADLRWFDGEAAVARGDAPQARVVSSERHRLAPRLSLAPGLPPAPAGVDTLVVGVAGSHSRELDGLALTLGAAIVDGTSRGAALALGGATAGQLDGMQLSIGANAVGGDARGIQGTVGANIATGRLEGLQASVGGNLAGRDSKGVQLAVGANLVNGSMQGWQASVGANVAGEVEGIQATVGANLGRDVQGAQASVGFNVARDVRGLQVSNVNVAQDVRGAQIGLLNFGRDVNGAQIGLINVARDVDGISVGLLSFEKEGRHDLLLYANETDLVNLDLKLGGDVLYTVLAAGLSPYEHAWAGLGYGGHARLSKALWLDIDAMWQSYTPLVTVVQPVNGVDTEFTPFGQVPTQVVRARATLGAQLAKQFAVFGGVQMSARIPTHEQRLDIVPTALASADQEIFLWPGAFAGVQF